MKGGIKGFPRHEVSDNKNLVQRRFAVYGTINLSTTVVIVVIIVFVAAAVIIVGPF